MKKNKIIYWSVTGLISLGFLMSSFMYLSQNPELMDAFKKLGFPVFFVVLLGIAKLLGALALVNPWFPKLKEWAYAGFTFTLTGAVWTHAVTQTPFISPLVFLLLLGVSYWYFHKIRAGEKEVGYVVS